MPVVIQPHTPIRLKGQESTKERADEGHEPTKDWDGTGDDVGNDDRASSTTEPGNPVDDGVLSDVLCATE